MENDFLAEADNIEVNSPKMITYGLDVKKEVYF